MSDDDVIGNIVRGHTDFYSRPINYWTGFDGRVAERFEDGKGPIYLRTEIWEWQSDNDYESRETVYREVARVGDSLFREATEYSTQTRNTLNAHTLIQTLRFLTLGRAQSQVTMFIDPAECRNFKVSLIVIKISLMRDHYVADERRERLFVARG